MNMETIMMKKTTLTYLGLCFGIAFLLPTTAVSAEKFEAKTFLHEKCTGCHDSSVYTRKKRRVKSLSQLDTQVRMCDAQLGIKMFDEEVTSIVNYLDKNYYHFKQ